MLRPAGCSMTFICVAAAMTGCPEPPGPARPMDRREPAPAVPIDDVEIRPEPGAASPPLPRGAVRRWGHPQLRAGVYDHLFLRDHRLLLVEVVSSVHDFFHLRLIDLSTGQEVWARRAERRHTLDHGRRRLAYPVAGACRIVQLDSLSERTLPALAGRDPCAAQNDGRWLERLDRYWVHQTEDASEVLQVTNLDTGRLVRRIRPADSLTLSRPFEYGWTFLADGRGLWIWDEGQPRTSGVLVDLDTGRQRKVDAVRQQSLDRHGLETPVVQDATALGVVALLGFDQQIRAYDRRTFQPARLAGRTEIPGPALVLMGGARLLLADDRRYSLQDGRTGRQLLSVPRSLELGKLGVAPAERRIWIQDPAAAFSLHDLDSGRRIPTPGVLSSMHVREHQGQGRWLTLVAGTREAPLSVLDLRTGALRSIPKPRFSVPGQGDSYERAWLSADGRTVVAERGDFALDRLDATSLLPLGALRRPGVGTRLIPGGLDPTGRFLALSQPKGVEVHRPGSRDPPVLLPRTQRPRWVAWVEEPRSLLVCVEHGGDPPDDELLSFGGSDPGRFTVRVVKLGRSCRYLSSQGTGRLLLHRVSEERFHGFEVLTWPELRVIQRVATTKSAPDFWDNQLQAVISPDGKRMATLVMDEAENLRVDLVTVGREGARRMLLRTPGAIMYHPYSLRLVDKGTRVMLTLAPSTTRIDPEAARTWLWDFASGRLIHHVTWPKGYWQATIRGPGDTVWAVIDTHPGTAPFHREIWQGPPLRRIGTFESPTFDLRPVVFSPRRKVLFTNQQDGSVLMWRTPVTSP